jgi:hypothetical protein
MFAFRHTVGHDAGSGLHIHFAILDDCRAQHNAGIHFAVGGEIANATAIDTAFVDFQFVDYFHGAHLGGA